jgi:hypothetical protein
VNLVQERLRNEINKFKNEENFKYLPRFSVSSSIVGVDCLTKSEKVNFGKFPNMSFEEVSGFFGEN